MCEGLRDMAIGAAREGPGGLVRLRGEALGALGLLEGGSGAVAWGALGGWCRGWETGSGGGGAQARVAGFTARVPQA